eukprot:g23003.t1
MHPLLLQHIAITPTHTNLRVYKNNLIKTLPACIRKKRYKLSRFGNLDTRLRDRMVLDLSSAPANVKSGKKDRRGSAPLISGDTFRSFCPFICEYAGCNFKPQELYTGHCIFLEGNNEDKVVQHVMETLKTVGNISVILISHNCDYSFPVNAPHFPLAYDHTPLLESPKVFHWFASNCYWRGADKGEPRPNKLTCIPLGVENRYNPIGAAPARYFEAMSFAQKRSRVLLISFQAEDTKPDRIHALQHINNLSNTSAWITQLSRDEARASGSNGWGDWLVTQVRKVRKSIKYITRSFSRDRDEKIQSGWLNFANQVRNHRFTICPAGNGLDTHRHWESLLLGGIPVVKSSSLDSLLDDLPVVILKKWSELTEARLHEEWKRLQKSDFLLDKLFWPYWENQIRLQANLAKNFPNN